MNGLLTIVRNRCIIGFRKNGTVQFRKGESVISRQGTKAASHCLAQWTTDKRIANFTAIIFKLSKTLKYSIYLIEIYHYEKK